MKIQELNGLNIKIDKKLELMLAFHAVYLKKHPEMEEEFNFIEIPPIYYLEELEQLINVNNYQKLVDALIEFKDESTCVEIALGLNDNYELDENKIRHEHIDEFLGNVILEDFVRNFKSLAMEIKWDEFFDNHKEFYQKLFSTFCDFPKNLDLNDIQNFYGEKATSYNYIPSILMNGGFSYNNKLGNLYYIRGIQWVEEKNNFYYDKEYLLECLFHEFSHPIVNCLVDKNLHAFTNLNKLYDNAIEHNLPKTYSKNYTLLYEYFVRANANILTRKYYPNAKIEDWILEHGFLYLNDIIDYTIKNMVKYNNYKEFFEFELISFITKINKCSD